MAFHDLGTVAARQLLVHDYGETITGVSANPAAQIKRAGHLVRYLNNYQAIVRTSSGVEELETSTAPLRVGGNGTAKKPVDLDLLARKDWFAPQRALTHLSIAKNSGYGVMIGGEGLRVTLEGANW